MKNKIKISISMILICLLIILLFINTKGTKSKDYDEIAYKIQTVSKTKESEIKELWEKNIIGLLEIPKINLKLSIAEGIEKEVLANHIGHFPSTSLLNGNVGFAGHNTNEFFANLKNLHKEDEIIYNFLLDTKTYKIETIEQIQDDDWSYLEDTKENKITLITCIKKQPMKRLCIQAVEKEN